jgi:HlyD family secretion protein
MRRPWQTAFLVAAFATLAGCAAKEQEAPKPVVAVKIASAELADLQTTVSAPATVFARQQASIAARLTAPVKELRVRKGDRVASGQILARLENRDLLAQQAEAQAAVGDAEANLAKVSSGTLPTDIEHARGQVAVTEAALTQAQKFYERRKQLYDQGAIPGRDLVVSETELAQSKTNRDVAKKSLELLEEQSKERDIQIARSRVEQARSHVALLDAQLAFADIRSPFDGVVTDQLVFAGDMAKPDTPMFTVADLSVAVARGQVPEGDSAGIRLGQACSLVPIDRPEDHFNGKISVVSQAVDPARRTVEIWCEIPNANAGIRAGTFGTMTVITGTVKQSVVVPVSAVQFEEGSRKGVVMVVDSNKKAQKREIEAGMTTNGRVSIKEGLKAGERVIIQGGYDLPDGTQVVWQ